MISYRALRRRWQARRRNGAPAHVPGRAHLVLRDGAVVEARLDPESQARLVYLARRVAAPPPPER